MTDQVACYVRVSTADQSLDRQLTATHDYAGRVFDVQSSEITTYRDKSTGTNTAREGYRSLMQDAEAGQFQAVVVKSISRVARSIRDLEATADRLEAADTALHVVDEGLTLNPNDTDPYQNALFRLLGVFAELEAEMVQQRTKEGIAARQAEDNYHHGRPPLGYASDDGHLVPAANYDQVATTLEQVVKRHTSKAQAARELDTSRKTINRALERMELYGL